MGTEKGLVEWKGKALIEYSIDCLLQVCETVVISSDKTCYRHLELQVVNDVIKNCGPMGGIYSCMKAISADLYVVLSCDVPNVPSDLLSDMIVELEDSRAIVATGKSSQPQPLIAVYSKNAIPVIEKELYNGKYKMMNLLALLDAKEFKLTEDLHYYHHRLLNNTNSPQDLNSL